MQRRLPCLLALSLATFHGQLAAATLTVGAASSGCNHTNIQAAINAAEANPGPDTIRITRSAAWTQQALVVNTSQQLEIVGGFATCPQATGDGVPTLISGAGGATEPVWRITGNTGALLKLSHLTISGGDEDGQGRGGGIYFRGNGSLEIVDSSITNNTAGYGGGIFAEGTGTNAELLIGSNVTISANTARYSGGGVYADQLEMAMEAPNSIIAFNTALGTDDTGYGGGLVIRGKELSGYAYIGSGKGGLGAIYGNEALRGGGVAVLGESNDAGSERVSELHLFTTDPDYPGSIRGNFASIAGGAIFARSYEGGLTTEDVDATAKLWYASLDDNSAPLGAAVYLAPFTQTLGIGIGSTLEFNSLEQSRGLPCPQGKPCGSIVGNVAWDAQSQLTDGALIDGRPSARIRLGRDTGLPRGGMVVSGNRVGRIVDAEDGYLTAANALIVANELRQQVVRGSYAKLSDITIAGNVIDAAHVLSVGYLQMDRAILWQPGTTSLHCSGCTRVLTHVLTSERFSMDEGNTPFVVEANPRFIDLARDDYRLRAASPAVDYAPPVVGDDRDVNGLPRDQDIAVKANLFGVRDLGAYERPTLLPLVLNSDFDVDLNLWTELVPGASSRDAAQNVVGAPGSGALLVSQSGIAQAAVAARTQCVHLPGPGRYALNGWGRSSGFIAASRDGTSLRWELRLDGGEECNLGPVVASGSHFLTTSSGWVRPANPAVIEVLPAQWTHNSSIAITLVVTDNGITAPAAVSGWFDGITLYLDTTGGDLLKDGFEAL